MPTQDYYYSRNNQYGFYTSVLFSYMPQREEQSDSDDDNTEDGIIDKIKNLFS